MSSSSLLQEVFWVKGQEGLVVTGLSQLTYVLTYSPSKGRGLNSDQVKEDAVINALNLSMEDSCSAPCFFK